MFCSFTIPFVIALYSFSFSFLLNSFPLVGGSPLLFSLVIVAFVICNGLAGFFVLQIKNKRFRVLCHGTTLLISFCWAAVSSVILHLMMLFGIVKCQPGQLLGSALFCSIGLFLLFWNGMICVYLTSVQLGIRIRVIGLICGLIPIANLLVLIWILRTVYEELRFESLKETINREREVNKICQTRYPILFVHGVFFRDSPKLSYWGRIPKELTRNGAVCFFGEHQSATSVADSAWELTQRIRQIKAQTGCEKVNIIAHSKGGLDCRYAMAHCGAAPMVASLTTINTPHRGCLFAEWLMKHAPEALKTTVSTTYNGAAKLLGDTEPDFIAAVTDLQADVCSVFDQNTPAPEGVYCQSVGSVMQRAGSGKFPLNLSYNFVRQFDGKNDGLVGVESFRWGSHYTLLDLPVKRGISHADMIDLNRENISGFDVREFYVNLAADLKQRGM